ncbi:AGAP001789-PA [Anopheles gambiae str. PEST]|uniref:Methionine synthase reductase n=1 Tax=Anopheles gambiae TaxID=7165 RepID=A7UVJ5_ANOGA|nr:AGAP001789-PA [Anopheles gambiae str. PEST]
MSTEVLLEFEGKKLTLPALPSSYIILEENTDHAPLPVAHLQANVTQPFGASNVVEACVSNLTTIVEGEDVKTVHDLTLSYPPDTGHRHWPGDTIGILSYNTDADVEFLLARLNLLSKGDVVCKVGIDKKTTKKAAKVPAFVPAVVSYRRLIKECLDLHAVPKKLLICSLTPFTTDDDDRRFLEILCSKEGNAAYEQTVQKGKGIISLLQLVPSCRPTVALLIEHLPRLMPRPYSIANAYREGASPTTVRFIFSHNAENPGITTSHLRALGKGATVHFYFRQSSAFVYEQRDLRRNIIMVGTGTGMSPYLSFLQLRADALAQGETLGRAELIVGFRYRDRGYLCKAEVEEYLETGALDACYEAFSRDPNARHKYVQSQMKENGKKIVENIHNPHATLYVCGDSKVLLPQITETVIDILAEAPGAEDRDAIKTLIGRLKKEGKYREDVWL